MEKVKLYKSEGYARFNEKRQGLFITHKKGVYEDKETKKEIPYHKVRLTQVFKPIILVSMEKRTVSNCHEADIKKKNKVSHCQECNQPCTPVKGKVCPFCSRLLSNDIKIDNLGICPRCDANLIDKESTAISMTMQRPYRFISFDVDMLKNLAELLDEIHKEIFGEPLLGGEIKEVKPTEPRTESDEVDELLAQLQGMQRRK